MSIRFFTFQTVDFFKLNPIDEKTRARPFQRSDLFEKSPHRWQVTKRRPRPFFFSKNRCSTHFSTKNRLEIVGRKFEIGYQILEPTHFSLFIVAWHQHSVTVPNTQQKHHSVIPFHMWFLSTSGLLIAGWQFELVLVIILLTVEAQQSPWSENQCSKNFLLFSSKNPAPLDWMA